MAVPYRQSRASIQQERRFIGGRGIRPDEDEKDIGDNISGINNEDDCETGNSNAAPLNFPFLQDG